MKIDVKAVAAMSYGCNRIPIVSWLRAPATESLPHERDALAHYHPLLGQVEGRSVQIGEYAREMILQEEQHLGEVDETLRKPGDIGKAGG